MKYYGSSRGHTGDYGVGDIVEGLSYSSSQGEYYIDDEPVFNVFIIDNGLIKYIA